MMTDVQVMEIRMEVAPALGVDLLPQQDLSMLTLVLCQEAHVRQTRGTYHIAVSTAWR